MNEELIEKLSYEARNYAHEQNDLYGVSYIRTFEQKFAELIVRECVRFAKATPCPYQGVLAIQYGHTWDMACIEAGKFIEEKLGIEE